MIKFVIGVIVGAALATVGFSGAVRAVDRGVDNARAALHEAADEPQTPGAVLDQLIKDAKR